MSLLELSHPVAPDGVWTAIHKQSGTVFSGRHPAPTNMLFLRGHNVYYTVNGCTLPVGVRKPTRHHVRTLRGMLFDFDPVGSFWSGTSASNPNPPLYNSMIDEDAGKQFILPFEHQYFSGVFSGRGCQFILNIEPHKPTHEPDWYEARHREIMRDYFTRNMMRFKHYKLDVSCTDLARLARLPDTTNHRTGLRAKLVTPASRTLPRAEYEDWLSQYTPAPRLVPQPVDIAAGGIPGILDAMTITARSYIYDGAAVGNRHHKAFAAAANLVELGVPAEIALYLLAQGDRLCANPLNLDELTRIYRNAHLKIHGQYPEGT